MEHRLTVRLTLKAYESLLPVATGFVEKAALAFGLGQEEALSLALATEEIFVYLCDISAPGTEVDIQCRSGGYCVEVGLLFETHGFQMRAFNLTAAPSFEDEASAHETGLIIASRLVDRFNLEHVGKRLFLTLIKDKAYPETNGQNVPMSVPLYRFFIRRPDGEEVKAAVRMIGHYCRDTIDPPNADFPGKVADIFASGEVDAALAMDTAGHMGGVLFWTRNVPQVVECFGPYVFHPESDPEMAVVLLDRCMEEIARSGAVGLINRYPGTGLPPGYFESVGSLSFFRGDGTCVEVESSYRQLGEDKGIAVWAHPDMVQFLKAQYERFTLPREIRRVTAEGEGRSPFSVLSAEVDRFRHWATLRPLGHGEDAATVLEDHVRILEKEGFLAIFFEMDLKDAWQAHFTPGLLKNGFEPRLVLPYGGRGDLVVFQHRVDGPK
jgi:anti-sigma regulatory factor (Ser/Thr protein kinase)